MHNFTVYIAHPLFVVREGLRALLQSQRDIRLLGDTADRSTALAQIQDLAPDLAIVGCSLRPQSDMQLMRQIQHHRTLTRVLLIAVHHCQIQQQQAIEAGAAGYISIEASTEKLLDAIRRAADHHRTFTLQAKRQPGGLSQREEVVLRQLALGYTSKEIAQRLEVSPKTVETYKARSLVKLRISDRSEIVRYAQYRGWLESISAEESAAQDGAAPLRNTRV